jgi:CBS domain-containing protein
MRARDLMQTRLITIAEDLPIEDVAEIFIRERISGAPVVDSAGKLVGIVSREDVFFGACTLPSESVAATDDPSVPRRSAGGTRAGDVMTSPAIYSTEDASVRELAGLMWKLRLHRVPIVRDGVVVGIVSSMDLCRVISQGPRQPETA